MSLETETDGIVGSLNSHIGDLISPNPEAEFSALSRPNGVDVYSYLALPQKLGFSLSISYDETGVIKTGAILFQPCRYQPLICQRQEMAEVTMR